MINARSGDIYELTIDIAKARDGRTILYATSGKTKKVGNVQVSSLMLRGSGQNSNLEDNVTYDVIIVKKDFSRQRIGDAWEEIRDMISSISDEKHHMIDMYMK